ncbi:hypothetical protein CFAM422_009531 [Trichoderma lentiforme]|uniref:Uncharacterized protein n=1 Tax=Trichoderma lentiforme TaxID=1567552 RepID=A0A9P5CAH9_9HYPO|nr:hypothetical protein CFAM422_009531 [Trichoderma lentiforme]
MAFFSKVTDSGDVFYAEHFAPAGLLARILKLGEFGFSPGLAIVISRVSAKIGKTSNIGHQLDHVNGDVHPNKTKCFEI